MAKSIWLDLYDDYIKKNKRTLLVITLVIIFAAASYYAYQWFGKPRLEGLTGASDVANANNRPEEIQVYLFYANWCPHCKKAKPHWDEFKKSYDGKVVKGSRITTIEVDCTDGASPLIQEYKINGYPTVFMKKDGNKIDFDSKITTETLTQFVDSVL
jgi:thiol-disulfide isomerase/thioredoxin